MGKRSSFKRMKGDFYVTPKAAVLPLLPFLPYQTYYTEPCAGNGALIDHLAEFGHMCATAYDIEPKSSEHDIEAFDCLNPFWARLIITNPPWSRDVLHSMIQHFRQICPAWLLFDADWMHTKQAAPFLRYCHKIVSVGRVSWMDNGVSGVDNAAWYYFGNVPCCPRFYGRGFEGAAE